MGDLSEHERLLSINLEQIEHAHTRAIAKGCEFPLILGFDLREKVAQDIHNILGGRFLVGPEPPPDNPITIYFVDLDKAIVKIGIAYEPAEASIRGAAEQLLRSAPGDRGCLYYFVAGGVARAAFHRLPV